MIQYFLHCIRAHASLTAECSKCGIETIFSGVMWIRTNTRKHLSYQYQCQGCGKLKYSDKFSENGSTVALSEACECSGQYRRDKNLFCPKCNHRKTAHNQSEKDLTLTDEQVEILEYNHGKESNCI